MNNCSWEGLEDCVELLKTGKYEVLTRTEDGEKFVFPITEPELHTAYLALRTNRNISNLGDFSVMFPQIFHKGYHSWFPTDSFILHIRPCNLDSYYDKIAHVGRFSYEPESGEFLPATIDTAHNGTIRMFGTHPFNEYVRGIYVREKKLILIRPYYNPLDEEGRFDPYRGYDPGIDRIKMTQTIDMLVDNGLPEDLTIVTRANNELIKSTCLKGLIGHI